MKKLIVFSCEIRSRVKCGLHRGEYWRLFTILWYNITKKKRGKNENLKPERVFHPSASVCVHQRVWKTGEKKENFCLTHTNVCFFKDFFLLLFLLESCRSLVFFLLRYYSDGGYHQMGGRQWLLPTSITVRHNRTCRRPSSSYPVPWSDFTSTMTFFFSYFLFAPFFNKIKLVRCR